jgi:lysophospholipid acyltransferase (LPLAT)-like uncharacterized protein
MLVPATLRIVHVFTRKQRLLLAFIPPLAALLIRTLGATWRYRDVNAPATAAGHTIPGPTIFAFWHCSLLACAWRFRNLGIAILISRSFDGELIARTVQRLGFYTVRGSSSRAGATGLRGMAQAYEDGRICAFTADGPKGPARVAKPGPVQLADLIGATWIGAYHAQPNRAWILRTWDSFMIPQPFATITFAWPAHILPDPAGLQQALDTAVAMCTELPAPDH